MLYLFIVIFVVLVAFAGVILRGAPYLPTLRTQGEAALELLGLKPGETLLELGSGDGQMLVLAARAGLQAVGIELNPFLVIVSRLRTWRYRKQVRIIWGDFWHVPWPECDGVFTFLLGKFMPRLDKRMQHIKKPLASFAFKIPDKPIQAEKAGVYLYKYGTVRPHART
ncbi:MAG TPA: methyltransferase domain-containing protein [Candidatus Saccharimonadales bacterium]|nr:methyltransferase domain-containing protein [Candidatus Saccharimonadales bacterium]